MAWTRYHIFLVITFVIAGCGNTLLTKWEDRSFSKNSAGEIKRFVHPFVQAGSALVGEVPCLLLFKILMLVYSRRNKGSEDTEYFTKGNREFNPIILAVPALCDLTATSLNYLGLSMTFASSYQMLKGACLVFTAIFSYVVLKRVLSYRQWSGIILVILGLLFVGLSDLLYQMHEETSQHSSSVHSKKRMIIGDILIICAQTLTATQVVIEEKYVACKNIPVLQAVGWEGFFGSIAVVIFLTAAYFIPCGPPLVDNPRGVLEDVYDAFVQISNNYQLMIAFTSYISAISFFAFCGITISREKSAVTRMVMDSVRTFVVWTVSITVFGQKFQWLQLVGFMTLLCGMCVYIGAIKPENWTFYRRHNKVENEPCVTKDPEIATIKPISEGKGIC